MDVSATWAEPVLGIQNQFNFQRWFILLQGDFGGYLVNTKNSSLLQAMVYYRTGRLTSIKLGWNYLTLNHEESYLDEDLRIRVTPSGPIAGITFHF